MALLQKRLTVDKFEQLRVWLVDIDTDCPVYCGDFALSAFSAIDAVFYSGSFGSAPPGSAARAQIDKGIDLDQARVRRLWDDAEDADADAEAAPYMGDSSLPLRLAGLQQRIERDKDGESDEEGFDWSAVCESRRVAWFSDSDGSEADCEPEDTSLYDGADGCAAYLDSRDGCSY